MSQVPVEEIPLHQAINELVFETPSRESDGYKVRKLTVIALDPYKTY